MSIKHQKNSGLADTSDPTLVQPSDWNATHTIDPGTVTSAMMTTPAPPVAGAYTNADITVDSAGRIIGVATGTGGTSSSGLSGAITHLAVLTGAGATASAGQITDDGTVIKFPNICVPYTDLGTLAGGNVDLDLTAYSTTSFKMVGALGGTNIRSIKTRATVTGNAGGQIIYLFNAGNSTLPGDFCITFSQDDGTALYNHIHLEARQPWHVTPALSVNAFRFDDATSKWHMAVPGNFTWVPRPIPILFSLTAGNKNDIAPVDSVTGMNGRYASWWRVIPVAGTIITGIEGSAPTGGSNWARRIMMTNYGGVSCTIAHGNSGGGTSTYPTYCPGATPFTWRAYASIWFVFDEANHIWLLEGI